MLSPQISMNVQGKGEMTSTRIAMSALTKIQGTDANVGVDLEKTTQTMKATALVSFADEYFDT
jgi:hypothetical protein